MSGATRYLEQQVINNYLTNQTTFVALFSTAPSNDPDPTNQITGDEYSPVEISAGTFSEIQTNGSLGDPTKLENTSIVNMGKLDTAGSVTVQGVVIYDGVDPSTSNALFTSDTDQAGNSLSVTVDAGDKLEFESGGITFQIG